MKSYNLENRRFVIGGVALAIVLVYIIRLFTIQLLSDDFKKNADSNAFLKKIDYPSRGAIYDRNGKLMVYNQPSYDIMVVMNEAKAILIRSNSAMHLVSARSISSNGWMISRIVTRILATVDLPNSFS